MIHKLGLYSCVCLPLGVDNVYTNRTGICYAPLLEEEMGNPCNYNSTDIFYQNDVRPRLGLIRIRTREYIMKGI